MTELVISFEVDGIHFWPNAPEQYKEFSHPHRHLFKVICWYPTGDSDDLIRREREFWELRQQTIAHLHDVFGREPIDFGPRSCEGISDFLKKEMGFSRVFCGEDWFLGATVS